MTVRKTIILTEQQDGWSKTQTCAEVEAIRTALIESENSGPPIRFDVNVFKQRMQKRQKQAEACFCRP